MASGKIYFGSYRKSCQYSVENGKVILIRLNYKIVCIAFMWLTSVLTKLCPLYIGIPLKKK